jgi:hypothetical protein
MSLEIGNLPPSILTAEDKFLANRLGNPVQVPLFVLFENKQDKLVSGFSIKNINGESLLGSGDIAIATSWAALTGKPTEFTPSAHTHVTSDVTGLAAALSNKQDTLVSATNIKTVNGTSLLGSGNVTTSWSDLTSLPSSFPPSAHTHAVADVTGLVGELGVLTTGVASKQDTLVSTSNIKSINGASILGSGDLTVVGVTPEDRVKIDSMAYGASANAPDSILLNRTSHYGEQGIETIIGLRAALDASGGGGGVTDGDKGDVVVASSGTVWTVPDLAGKQATLVSATNIKTINGTTLLGSGDLVISGGLSDGDKGDITVSGTGATWTIDSGVVTNAKLTTVATATLKGRSTAGTGAVEDLSAATARTLLNVADGATVGATWGTNLSSIPATITTIAGLTATTDNFIQSKAGAWASRTVAQVKTDLGLTGTNSGDQTSIAGITGTKAQFDTAVTDGNFLYADAVGVSVQAYSAVLAATTASFLTADETKLDGIATSATVGATWGTNLSSIPAAIDAIDGLTPAADRLAYYTGASTAALATLTTAGRNLLDDADASAQRTTLGLGTAAVLKIHVGTVAPGSPSVGDLWVDTN